MSTPTGVNGIRNWPELRGLVMLVLSRRDSESILIGDSISVTVIEIRGDKVRLGVTAPKAVPIHRDEVYLRMFGELPPGLVTTARESQLGYTASMSAA